MPRDAHDILTSLPLEILLYFNQYFTILYVVLTVGQLVYKGKLFFHSVFFLFYENNIHSSFYRLQISVSGIDISSRGTCVCVCVLFLSKPNHSHQKINS